MDVERLIPTPRVENHGWGEVKLALRAQEGEI